MKRIYQIWTIALLLSLAGASALAQGTESAGTPPSSSGSSGSSTSGSGAVTGGGNAMNRDASGGYRIGPGDVLDVRVFNRPQLSREVRVDNEGNIQMPLLEAPLRAACLNEGELAKSIGTAYLKYQRNPYVSVFIKEFSSQPIAVIGAVEKPGQIILRRRMRLFDAITLAGGPSKLAGSSVEIAHTGGSNICDQQHGPAGDGDIKSGFVAFTLSDTLRGDERANPWLQPGDYVRVPEADQAWVIGNVNKPSPVSLREPTTLMRAVAAAEGWSKHSKLTKVTILRAVAGNPEGELIAVDLQAISQRKAPDILLQSKDIVYVPIDSGAVTRAQIFQALTGGLSGLPYLIP